MKYMTIILEHGSTEDDELNSIEISQKKIVEPSDNQEEENTSDSSNSSKRTITKDLCRSQKKMRKDINRRESEFSHSSDSDNEMSMRKKLNFDNSQEYDSSSSEKNVNGNLKNKNVSASTLHTDRNKYQNQLSNVDDRYNSEIIPRSES